MQFSDRQHGFKKNHSTSSACLVLKETVHYYINANSNVYSCFLDISKAFDSVSHKILIEKLVEGNLPVMFINIIQYWYSHQFVKVRFGNSFSDEWKLCNGVRQGGVLSGIFFNLYIDSLIQNIGNKIVGCKFGALMSNIIGYADDIVLLAPSRTGLQILIDNVLMEASKIEFKFNDQKSKCMTFGTSVHYSDKMPFMLGEKPLEFVSDIKYLGYHIQSNLRNNKDINESLSKFYREFNIILRRMNFADTRIKLYLFKQCCLQIYGAELWFHETGSMSGLKQFGIGYHKAIKKDS